MTPEAAELEHDRRQGQLDEFYEDNEEEILDRALELALESDDLTDRIIDIVGDYQWNRYNIGAMGPRVKHKLIAQFEKKAELELRRECGI